MKKCMGFRNKRDATDHESRILAEESEPKKKILQVKVEYMTGGRMLPEGSVKTVRPSYRRRTALSRGLIRYQSNDWRPIDVAITPAGNGTPSASSKPIRKKR